MTDVEVITKEGTLFGSDVLANAIVIVTPARSAVVSTKKKTSKNFKNLFIFSPERNLTTSQLRINMTEAKLRTTGSPNPSRITLCLIYYY
jgi:hypothetical protein